MPNLLVLHGEVMAQPIQREGIDEEALEAALREHGVAETSGVEMVVQGIDGSVSVVSIGRTTTRVKKSLKFLLYQ